MTAFRRVFALIGSSLLLIIVLLIVALPVVLVAAFVAASSSATLAGIGGGSTGVIIGAVVAAVAILALVLFVAVSIIARSAVMTALVIVEGLGPIEALRRSQSLSSGSYLLLAKTYALVMVIAMVVYGVLAGVAAAFQDQQQVVQALLSVLIIPIVPIFGGITLLTYADLRVRREGADLDAELDALSVAPIPQA